MESLVVVVRVPPANERSSDDAVVSHTSCSDTGYSGGETSDEHDTTVTVTRANAVGTKRRTSYNMQKDEIATLRTEAEALERQIKRLEAQHPAARALEHFRLQTAVRANRLVVANAQSLVSSLQDDEPPIGAFIHLPHEPLDRQRVINALKPHEIESATMYMLARCQHVDLSKATRQSQVYTTAAGDHAALLWEVAHVTQGRPTLRRVLDEMLAFSRVREMAMADRRGVLDVRESDLDVDPSDIAQSRILSTAPNGLLLEKNGVAYAQYFEKSALHDKPFAVYVIDSVDRDDAYPYDPATRIRQDGVSAMLVLEVPGQAETIAVVKYSFVRVRQSPLATAEQLSAIAENALRSCSSVMLDVVRERLLYPTTED